MGRPCMAMQKWGELVATSAFASLGTTSPLYITQQAAYLPWCGSHLAIIDGGSKTLLVISTTKSYDLHHFIDGAHTPPPSTVTVTGVASSNLAYTTKKRQDRLIFSALLGAISISLQPLIARTTTFLDAWQTLANTYAKPSREKPVDDEDLIDRVLEGISDEYKSVIDAINVHDTSISFVELHEKLLNKEASLQTAQPFPLYQQRKILLPSGIVQIGVHQPPFHNNQALPLRTQGYHSSTPWQPRVNHVVLGNTTTWLLDSGTSHHVMSDLSNLSLHSPYQGFDDIMIGDRSVIPITHTCSTTIPTSSRTFTLQNDRNTGTIFLMGELKDDVYEWSTTFPSVTSSPLLAFSSVKTTSSE
ncbi:Retrovirus-related Pol polyprotein from transposon RE2 [Vitis vinifera]|uniref:Retrovirus-related Pol polyprotein from transposon RE2 n=1 Tax=Vitis vinifera TaxID=29760 RepID=A0A438FU51_VITVI|nr:Retrovirus-related Pol polyprotein from transposon RE2 [Vitis vinifera]